VPKNGLVSRQTIKQASILIAVISITSQGLGVIRESLIANYLGTSAEYDLLLIAMALPVMVSNILFLAIPSAGIPFLQSRNNVDKSEGISSLPFIKTNSLIILIIAGVIFFTLPLFRGILSGGSQIPEKDMFVTYGRLFCLIIPFRAYEAIFRSLMQKNRNFLFPAVAIFGFNLTFIGLMYSTFPSIGNTAFVLSWMLGTFIQSAIVIIPYYFLFHGDKTGRSTPFDSSGYLKYLGLILIVETFGLVVEPFDRYLAGALLTAGYVSANYYAIVIGSVPVKIFIYGVATATFPALSEYAAQNDFEKLRSLYHRSLVICVVVIIPIAAFIFLYKEMIISILFERGLFGVESRMMTIEVLVYYLLGMILTAILFVQLKLIYAIKKWRFLILSRIISFGVKVAIGLTFIKYNWALALGGGSVTMAAVNCVLLEFYLVRKHGLNYSSRDLIDIGKAVSIVAITIAIFLVLNMIFRQMGQENNIISAFFTALIGFGGLILLDYRMRLTGLLRKRE